MIVVTEETKSKIKLLEEALASLSLDDVSALVSADRVVGKLKGEADLFIFERIISDLAHSYTQVEILNREVSTLRSDIMLLRNHLTTLIKCLNKGMGDTYSVADFNSMKSALGVY